MIECEKSEEGSSAAPDEVKVDPSGAESDVPEGQADYGSAGELAAEAMREAQETKTAS